MAITWQGSGSIGITSAGGVSLSVQYPGFAQPGDKLVLIIGQKPSVANGGTVTTPTGWTLVTSLVGAGGYGTTLGADTGNTNLFVFERTVPSGGLSGGVPVTLGNNNVSWGVMLRMTSGNGLWSAVAGATGSDAAAGNVSIAFSANPGVQAGDVVVGAMCIPTDVTTPSQFSAQAFSQPGVTFGTVTEVGEPDATIGNQAGGFICYATVASGTATGNPTMTATAAGTTTNVRGPGVFIRVREGAPVEAKTGICTAAAQGSASVRGAKRGLLRAQAVVSAVAVLAGARGGVAWAVARGMAAWTARGVKGAGAAALGVAASGVRVAGAKGAASRTALLARAVTLVTGQVFVSRSRYIVTDIAAKIPGAIAIIARRLPPVAACTARMPAVIALAVRRLPPVVAGAGRIAAHITITARTRKPE